MNKENHGLCLIINNETFEIEGKNRRGSSKDVKTLKKLFTELRFTIIVKKDVRRSELDEVLNNFANDERHKKAEMCIVIVMSHGDNGAIETVDGRMVSTTICQIVFGNKFERIEDHYGYLFFSILQKIYSRSSIIHHVQIFKESPSFLCCKRAEGTKGTMVHPEVVAILKN